MKIIEKLSGIITIIIIAFGFTACGGDDVNTSVPHTHNNWDWVAYTTGSGLRECQTDGCTITAGVGDTGSADGIIFFAAASGFTVTGIGSFTAYYLEAAPTNQETNITWSSANIDVTGAEGTAIGTGKANTAAIITAFSGDTTLNNAAIAASEYTGGEKNDWFLPSKDELNEIYKAKRYFGISSGGFWSSSQVNDNNAWNQYFSSGNQHNKFGKNILNNVRAARAF